MIFSNLDKPGRDPVIGQPLVVRYHPYEDILEAVLWLKQYKLYSLKSLLSRIQTTYIIYQRLDFLQETHGSLVFLPHIGIGRLQSPLSSSHTDVFLEIIHFLFIIYITLRHYTFYFGKELPPPPREYANFKHIFCQRKVLKITS